MTPPGPEFPDTRLRNPDAEAICEAVSRPSMRFVPVKSEETQALLLCHKAREFLVRQLTQVINAIRAHLGEFGIVLMVGGSIPGETRTIAVAIYDRVQAFDDASANAMSAFLLALSLWLAVLYGAA